MGDHVPGLPGCERILGHAMWDVRMDFTRYVAGSHNTDPSKALTYSSVARSDKVPGIPHEMSLPLTRVPSPLTTYSTYESTVLYIEKTIWQNTARTRRHITIFRFSYVKLESDNLHLVEIHLDLVSTHFLYVLQTFPLSLFDMSLSCCRCSHFTTIVRATYH